jgi:hypothetical protein
MNITVLKKIESGWINLNWKEYIDKVKLSNDDIDTLIGVIDAFKGNKRAIELAVVKYRHLPAYITVKRDEYIDFLDWIYNQLIEREMYETCKKLIEIKRKLLCTNLKK